MIGPFSPYRPPDVYGLPPVDWEEEDELMLNPELQVRFMHCYRVVSQVLEQFGFLSLDDELTDAYSIIQYKLDIQKRSNPTPTVHVVKTSNALEEESE